MKGRKRFHRRRAHLGTPPRLRRAWAGFRVAALAHTMHALTLGTVAMLQEHVRAQAAALGIPREQWPTLKFDVAGQVLAEGSKS